MTEKAKMKWLFRVGTTLGWFLLIYIIVCECLFIKWGVERPLTLVAMPFLFVLTAVLLFWFYFMKRL